MKLPKCFVRGALSALCLFAPAARADLVYNLTFVDCWRTCDTDPIEVGTVDLHQVDADEVQVSVTLTGSEKQGAVSDDEWYDPIQFGLNSFQFNIGGAAPVSISNLPPGFAAVRNPSLSGSLGGSLSGRELGGFDDSIDSTDGSTEWFRRHPLTSSLVFDVTAAGGLSMNDFVANKNGFYFAAGIADPWGEPEYFAVSTGSGDSPAAEPSGMVLLPGALGGLWFARRRRRNKTRLAIFANCDRVGFTRCPPATST